MIDKEKRRERREREREIERRGERGIWIEIGR
jgi:hypothetical protein